MDDWLALQDPRWLKDMCISFSLYIGFGGDDAMVLLLVCCASVPVCRWSFAGWESEVAVRMDGSLGVDCPGVSGCAHKLSR
jgi:hypothetical protein